MQFPRHNVQQFSGNAIWDGRSLTLASAVGAMLGDPFELAVSPELDALRHLFLGHGQDEMLRELGRRWHDDGRYPAHEMARGSQDAFLAAMRGLTRTYVEKHATWPRLASDSARQRIEASMRGSVPMSHAAATCAAMIVMDGIFAKKSVTDIWVTSLFAAGAGSRNSEADPTTLLRQLYVMDAGGTAAIELDPAGEIYTTPYQSHANGFYGGNMSFAFKPADSGGSGVDTLYLSSMLCPGPPPQGMSQTAWHSQWCTAREQDGALEFARSNSDAGETRTPNYKAPHEIDGVMLFAWGPDPSVWGPANSFDFDVSTLMRPLQWAYYRSAVEDDETVLVLAGVLVGGVGIYGIRPQEVPQKPGVRRFLAIKPPPESMGGPRSDEPIATNVPFSTLDRAPLASPERIVPVWGVLYRCTTSNLESAADATRSYLFSSHQDRQRMCAAASTLRVHTQVSLTESDAPLRQALEQAALPASVARELASTSVWPSSAVVDLEHSIDVVSAPQDAVCVLSLAWLQTTEETCREFS